MKIVWLSNAGWANTGYGVQTAMFTRRIRDAGHDVAISAQYGLEGALGEWEGMTVYPTDHTHWGKHMLRKHVAYHAGDDKPEDVLVITLMDVWTWVDVRFGGMPADFQGLNLAAWTPVDHDPAPPKVLQALEAYKVRPIAMTRFGQQQLQAHGFDALYVPHGVETDVFKPYENRAELKEAMGLDPDRFVVGMVANNQGCMPPRKAFPQVFQAFAQFHQQHPDSFLYVHADVLGVHDGINLNDLALACGLPEGSYGSVQQDKYALGKVSPDQMARVYSIMDVLANPSYGEGFGIPVIEAQACGTPVLVTDWTAMPELCGAGWKVQGDRWWNNPQSSWFMCPSVYEIVDALEQAYEARGDQTLRAQAREFALGYDADHVMDTYWKPALEQLGRPREVGPLANGNRAQRRAAKKKVAA